MKILVVGGGIYGITAAVELKKRGHSVTVLDRSTIPNEYASSQDISKLVRMDYGYDEEYMELMELALEGWKRFNEDIANGEELYHPDGILCLHKVTPKPGSFDYGCMETLKKRGHPFERLDKAAIKKRFPNWNAEAYSSGYFNPQGGWAESGKVCAAYAKLGEKLGVTFVIGEMQSLLVDGQVCRGVLLKDGRKLVSERVIVAAGAWTPVLLPHLQNVMWPTAQVVHHFQPENPQDWVPPKFPPYLGSIEETGFYGFPAHYTSDYRVKIGHHGKGIPLKSLSGTDINDALEKYKSDTEKKFRAFIADSYPSLSRAPTIFSRVCLYCDTFDGDFWIDRDLQYQNLFIASGGSGHGFKFATVFGPLISDLVEGKKNKFLKKFAARENKNSSKKEGARSLQDIVVNPNTIPFDVRFKSAL